MKSKNMNEEYLSKIRALELFEKDLVNNIEVGTIRGLQEIHRYLFQDVFDFAGEIRNVNLAKGNFRFAPVLFLQSNLQIIEEMPEGNFDKIIDKYVEMNVAHPFREGNGRATRIWLDQMLKKNLSLCVDWSKIDKVEYLQAMERSTVNTLEIKTLLKAALTDKVDDRQIYMRGIQASYYYEDQDNHSIEEIANDRIESKSNDMER